MNDYHQGVVMKTLAWTLLLALTMTACSRTKSAKSVSQDTPQIELSEADASEFAETDPLTEVPADSLVSDTTANEMALEDAAPTLEDATPAISNTPGAVTLGDGEGVYTVQKNETLMMIAFKLYGDYGQWRDLSRRNASKLKNGLVFSGTKITYALPSQTFEWSPQGNPYLIRTGDTLGAISGSVYGSAKKWKNIWENNRPLIKDPNRIFAGFTIYWPELGKVAASSTNLEL
jgi:nucleoid-associated protein YgaU